jgi:hypothetical protein
MSDYMRNSHEVTRPFDSMEFLRLVHIVADLDAIDEEDAPLDMSLGKRVRELYVPLPSLRRTIFTRALPIVLLAFLSACASTGSTFRSGVGDAFLENAPYYAGASQPRAGADIEKIGHLPIAFQRGAAQAPVFDPESGANSEVTALLAEMNTYIASLNVSVPLYGGPTTRLAFSTLAIAPDVQFGCATPGNLPGEDCTARGDSALGRGRQTMRLAVGRPSNAWVAETNALMSKAGTSYTLVITLEMGQYLTRQSGWRGSKSVELGTNNVEALPWLTSLETPVAVLQLTGALVDSSGKATRIGAEGIAAQRTRLLVSSIGGQELFGNEDVRNARTLRRQDLPDTPLAWQVALRQLVGELTGSNP